MAGSFGLRDARDADDIADAHFTFQEQVQNAQPGAIRESAKHQIDSRLGHKLYSLKRI